MNNLNRLKLELNNKQYFTDEEYTIFLQENNLQADTEYSKDTMQIKLLYTVIDIIEALLNDVDLYRRVETEFQTTNEATEFFRARIDDLKIRIQQVEDSSSVPEEVSPFTLMFTRRG